MRCSPVGPPPPDTLSELGRAAQGSSLSHIHMQPGWQKLCVDPGGSDAITCLQTEIILHVSMNISCPWALSHAQLNAFLRIVSHDKINNCLLTKYVRLPQMYVSVDATAKSLWPQCSAMEKPQNLQNDNSFAKWKQALMSFLPTVGQFVGEYTWERRLDNMPCLAFLTSD